MKSCSVEGCTRPYRNVGYCNAHYLKVRKYGDPLVDNRATKNTCTMPDCDRPAHGRELCDRHYKRWQVHGDPNIVITDFRRGKEAMPAEDLFWRHVRVAGPDECWEWVGGSIKKAVNCETGYGIHQWRDGGKRHMYAHRFSMLLHLGDAFDASLLVCHHCDNPPCVNPAHLYQGTHKDNARDMVQRGRHRNQFAGATS